MAAEPLVAVLGASGFIGNRIVEMMHLGKGWDVRPVVRRSSGLVLASRFGLEGRIADGRDSDALAAAFHGCDLVIHALAGDARTITGTIQPVYRAAARARCRRLIYLSSAMVHGQAPARDSDEHSPLPVGQALEYNRAKISAERKLFALGHKGPVEVVALRPGIVYGPRSQWIGGLADDLLAGSAAFVDGGSGLCNAIYVDNVVHAVALACTVPAAAGEAFLLGEDEVPTWREFYRRVAEALGLSIDAVPVLTHDNVSPSLQERVDALRMSRPVRAALARLPRPLREGLAAAWSASGALPPPPAGPSVNLEMALLHRARHVPSWQKARKRLDYRPIVAPDEAWRRTIAWLSFAHYPTVHGI